MRLSVLLTMRNRGYFVARVLESVTAQSLDQSDYEVVIVDDGSTDLTAALVDKFRDRLPIQYFYQDHAGIAAARNNGLARAHGAVVLLMDDDDIIEAETLSEHLKAHDQFPSLEIAVLGFTKLDKKMESNPLMSFVTETSGHLFSYKNLEANAFLDFRWFWGGRTSFKRDYVLQSGGFNPAFRFGCEDIELGYRLSKRGLRVIYNPRAVSILIRAISFDAFCHRLYMQGLSQRLFSNLYPNEVAVQEWCEIPKFRREWPKLAGEWRTFIDLGRTLDRCVAKISEHELEPTPEVLWELHQRYFEAFTAAKLAGIAGEAFAPQPSRT